MDRSGNLGVQYGCENGISLFCGRFEVSQLSRSVARKPVGRRDQGGGDIPLSASDSVGISLFFDGVDGPPSSLRW